MRPSQVPEEVAVSNDTTRSDVDTLTHNTPEIYPLVSV
jgi:hypothetical protein